jgi:hypothetical protein
MGYFSTRSSVLNLADVAQLAANKPTKTKMRIFIFDSFNFCEKGD